jgi:hypothetical protein
LSSAIDLLRAKARDYELRAANETERDELAQANGEFPSPMPMLWATAAVVLYEVAEALEHELEAA